MGKSNTWNEKYKEKELSLRDPSEFIVNNVSLLKKGTVLDLASGDGRNSIYLSKKGFDVTAVDFSIDGLKRLESFAYKEGVNVKTICLDLSIKDEILSLGKFDNIIICNYKLDDSLMPVVESLLNPNGILIYSTFNVKHHNEFGFNRDFCLEDGELLEKFTLKLLKYESLSSSKSHTDGYIFRSH